jgi:hypothetical protein
MRSQFLHEICVVKLSKYLKLKFKIQLKTCRFSVVPASCGVLDPLCTAVKSPVLLEGIVLLCCCG